MPKFKNNFLFTLLIALLVVVFIITVVSLVLFRKKKASFKSPPLQESSSTQQTFVIPTKTPQEIEIISKTETHTVNIENEQFNPPTLQIKLHDQVMWINKNSKIHKITGEGWGNVPIEDGESFVQAFNEPGTYSYSCALHPQIQGTIIVGE